MWRIGLYSLLLPIMAAVPLGIARASIAELTRDRVAQDSISQFVPTGRSRQYPGDARAATATVEAACGYLTRSLGELFDVAADGSGPTFQQRAAARSAAVFAAQSSADVVQECFRAAGSSAIRSDNPLQRHLRDVNTALAHLRAQP